MRAGGGASASAVSFVSHSTGRSMLERGACVVARGCRHGNRKLLYTVSMTNGAVAAIRSSLLYSRVQLFSVLSVSPRL
jgi:hypothetical protein